MNTGRLLVMVAVLAGAAAAQDAVQVAGAVKQPLTLAASDLAKMPRASVKMTSNGLETTYEGVWLHEILQRAGAPLGGALRGKALTTYVLVEAKDGYQVLFSLAELDPAFTENQVLLADQADGKPLVGSQGPFRLVAAKDKPGARSIRMVTRIEVVQSRK
jgi:DMSO/TMAO reductase YedYZ molybdopterin-dependent catalytic subunit